ncbi:Copper transport protein CTR2, partial [Tolypocladium capitatum]
SSSSSSSSSSTDRCRERLIPQRRPARVASRRWSILPPRLQPVRPPLYEFVHGIARHGPRAYGPRRHGPRRHGPRPRRRHGRHVQHEHALHLGHDQPLHRLPPMAHPLHRLPRPLPRRRRARRHGLRGLARPLAPLRGRHRQALSPPPSTHACTEACLVASSSLRQSPPDFRGISRANAETLRRKPQDDATVAETTPFLSSGQNQHQAGRRGHVVKAVLYGVQNFYAFMLMLVFMTYNGWVMVAVSLGAFFGYLVFGQTTSATKHNACH